MSFRSLLKFGAFIGWILALAGGLPSPAQAAKTATSASIVIEADDFWDLYINGVAMDYNKWYDGGTQSCRSKGPFYCKQRTTTYDILPYLTCGGTNTVATTIYDVPGGALVLTYVMTIMYDDGSIDYFTTDGTNTV